LAGASEYRAAVSALVIDSSAALSWCFEDEASERTDALFEQVRDQGAIVLGFWHLEVANVLLQAEKRGRITIADVTMRLGLIAELPIAIQ
jgi:predicted nucleic acid-binding protein